jgi:uncharacterized protein (TIGR02145 family)
LGLTPELPVKDKRAKGIGALMVSCKKYIFRKNSQKKCCMTGIHLAAAKQNAKYTTYGVLYNWTAAKAACPSGWHLPSDYEWTALETFLGGKWEDGGKLKETGTTHWVNPNTGATNEFGFSALPGGGIGTDRIFALAGIAGIWWSSTESGSSFAYIRYLNHDNSYIDRLDPEKERGFSVRCVKNK